MVIPMKVIIVMENQKEKENINGKMEHNLRVLLYFITV
jgi:hypothetical protein